MSIIHHHHHLIVYHHSSLFNGPEVVPDEDSTFTGLEAIPAAGNNTFLHMWLRIVSIP